MISRWRDAFGALALPFIYVELCREFGGYEPRTKDFWLAQRSALALPQVGFVTTTDIERNLHPPDKQDVARRLVLELRRLAYGEAVTARGPELVSITRSASEQVVLTFTNSTLHTHSGIYVGVQGQCAANAGTALDTVVTVAPKLNATAHGPQAGVAYTLGQGKGTLTLAKGVCGPGDWLWVSADISSCFLYGPTGLPAPPLFLTCPDLREKPEPKTALTPLKADDMDAAPAAVRFSNVFAASMVLQRNKPIQLWGFGTPLAGMTVCLASDCAPTTTAAQELERGGRSWSATLPARTATATPMTLTLRGVDNATLQELGDIVVGDVYLFSGQSNIDIPQTYGRQVYTPSLPSCEPQNMTNRLCSTTNTTAQQATEHFADRYGEQQGLLRIMIVAAPPSAAPNASTANPAELPEAPDSTLCPPPTSPYVACGYSNMRWTRANASNVRGFSATGWYAGSALLSLLEQHQPSLGVPIGLVRSSMGGTQIQLWSSPAALAACNTTAPATFWRPYSSLFLSMILPMKGLSFAALTWWQGEANVGPDSMVSSWGTGPTGPVDYSCQLPAMLSDWRKQLELPKLPVLLVELSAYWCDCM